MRSTNAPLSPTTGLPAAESSAQSTSVMVPSDVGRQTTLSRLRPHAVCPNVAKTFHRRGTQCAHCSPPSSSRFPPSPKSPPPPPPHPPRKRPRRPLLHRLLLQSRKRPRRLRRATPARTSTR